MVLTRTYLIFQINDDDDDDDDDDDASSSSSSSSSSIFHKVNCKFCNYYSEL